jgi:MFS transporter, PAT family, beta-lactamase induction signal transducer AmpG
MILNFDSKTNKEVAMAVASGFFSQEEKLKNFRSSYYLLQGLFYFLQGFFVVGTTVYVGVAMANWGLPLVVQTATQATIAIPTYLKMFTALMSDRLPIKNWGRRKPYMVIGTFLFVPAFIYMLTIKGFSNMWVFSLMVIFTALVLVDGTLDALTIDITPVEKQGTMQGVANGSRMAGYAAGAVVVPIIGPIIGWTATVAIIASCATLQGIAALFYKVPVVTLKDLAGELPVRTVFKKTFGSIIPWMGILFEVLIGAACAFSSVSSNYILTSLGWSQSPELLTFYGYSRLLHYIAAVIGAFLFGKLASKFKNSIKFYTASFLGMFILLIPWLFVPASPQNVVLVIVAQFLAGFAYGIANVLALAVIMQICDPGIEGFMFAVFMSFSNLGEIAIGANLITGLEKLVGGIPNAFFTLLPCALLSLVCLNMVFKAIARNKQQPAGSPVPEPGSTAS